jgi:hypothetical protein
MREVRVRCMRHLLVPWALGLGGCAFVICKRLFVCVV